MNLKNNIGAKLFFNLHDGGPENGSCFRISSSPERVVMEVFGFENQGEERILIVSYIIGSMNNEAFVDSVKIPDAKSTVVLALANVIPRSVGNWKGWVIFLDTCPPKSSDD
jgi:hypothetical protein